MSESRIQQQIVMYGRNELRLPKGTLFAIPNEGKRGGRFAARLLAQGMVAGVPDLCLVREGKVEFIEVKKSEGRLSATQKLVIENIERQGVKVHVVRSLEDFKKIVTP